MCAIIKTYELYLVETGELLSDGLTLQEVPELYKAYEDFYGTGSILVSYKTHSKPLHEIHTRGMDYKNAWIDYFEDLQLLGNLN